MWKWFEKIWKWKRERTRREKPNPILWPGDKCSWIISIETTTKNAWQNRKMVACLSATIAAKSIASHLQWWWWWKVSSFELFVEIMNLKLGRCRVLMKEWREKWNWGINENRMWKAHSWWHSCEKFIPFMLDSRCDSCLVSAKYRFIYAYTAFIIIFDYFSVGGNNYASFVSTYASYFLEIRSHLLVNHSVFHQTEWRRVFSFQGFLWKNYQWLQVAQINKLFIELCYSMTVPSAFCCRQKKKWDYIIIIGCSKATAIGTIRDFQFPNKTQNHALDKHRANKIIILYVHN